MPSEVGCLQIHRGHVGCEQHRVGLLALLSGTLDSYLVRTGGEVVLHIHRQLLSVDNPQVLYYCDPFALVALVNIHSEVGVLVDFRGLIVTKVLLLREKADRDDVALLLRSEVQNCASHVVDNLDLLYLVGYIELLRVQYDRCVSVKELLLVLVVLEVVERHCRRIDIESTERTVDPFKPIVDIFGSKPAAVFLYFCHG